MKPAVFYVYLISRLDGRPCYIGKGKGNRWIRHEGRARHYNLHLGSIIDQARALGKELPKVKIAENLTEDRAFELERELIAQIGREIHGGPLVNLTDGGDGPSGYKPTPERCAQISADRKGKLASPDTKQKLSAARKGRRMGPMSVEQRAKISAAKKGWKPSQEHLAHLARLSSLKPHKGYVHSTDAKVKIREARARQPRQISPATQFKPGGIPWNKGMIGREMISLT